ncbi:hypothetical protein M408DRAFT_28120 [Serendipita vermifera MAFF 305830]|uniref:F-box domain-containing protein n=1 Tax=Serendipita vermifera MAFF 305830 TaxID=933852 RepID=A0A0C2W9W7_SERVB|nr:hypothetical protein M408DRAFT_28120 [Serendipita vermifera MAFF 305830]
MSQTSSWEDANRLMLDRSIRAVEEMKEMIRDYEVQDTGLSEREASLRNQLKEVEFRRKQLSDTLEETRTSLERMESTVNRLKCVLSPMRRLPSDILLRIFHHFILQSQEYMQEKFEKWKIIETYPNPVILSSVCSHWRDVVKQNAKLWDSILVRIPTIISTEEEGEKKGEGHLNSIRHWMTFGLQERQSLFIDEYKPKVKDKMYAALQSESPLWKAITIAIINEDPFVPWDIGKLRADDVLIYLNQSAPWMNSVTELLRYATNLTLTGILPPWGDTPWASLRSLKILPYACDEPANPLNFGEGELRSILNAAIHLQTLELSFALPDETVESSDVQNQEKVEHQALKSLSIHMHHIQANGHLFGARIVGPCFENLIVLSSSRARLDSAPFIIETWQNFTSVEFHEIKDHEVPTVVEFLRRLPNVTNMEVRGKNIDALINLFNVFYAHVPPKYATIPVPKLTKFIMDATDIRGKTLISFLEKRITQREGGFDWISAMTEVKLYDADYVTPGEWARVNDLLQFGRLNSSSNQTGIISGQ